MIEAERVPNPERFARPDKHSVSMSKRLLSGDLEGKASSHTIGPGVSDEIKTIFSGGSEDNRGKYWDEKGIPTYGGQMDAWIKSTRAWLKNQKDSGQTELMDILTSVGLGKANHDELKNDPDLLALVDRINANLPHGTLNLATMDDTTREILYFYDGYLRKGDSPKERGIMTSNLIGDLSSAIAWNEDGKRPDEEIEKRLEAISPFLRVVGLDAQYALGAMLAAEVHAATRPEEVEKADVSDAHLKDEDKVALKFFRDYKDTMTRSSSAASSHSQLKVETEDNENEGKIVSPPDLITKFSQLPTFAEDEIDDPAQYNLTNDQKDVIRTTLSRIRLAGPVDAWLNVDEELAREVFHGKQFFGKHAEIVPIIHAFASDQPPTGKEQDQNETINQGESIFPGHQDFFTGLAALMGSEIKDPQVRAETQASASLALANAILQVYGKSEGAFNTFLETQFTDTPYPLNPQIYFSHDIARHLGMEINSQEDAQAVGEKIAALPEGVISPVNGPESTLFVITKTNQGPAIDWERTIQKLVQTSGKVYQEVLEGTLTSQGAMLIEFLGNGVDVTRLAEEIATRQKNTSSQNSPSPQNGGGEVRAGSTNTSDTAPAVGATDTLAATVAVDGTTSTPKPSGGEPAPQPSPVQPEVTMESTASTETMSTHPLGEQLVGKTIRDVDKWPNTKHITKLPEEEFNQQRANPTSDLQKQLLGSFPAGDYITYSVTSRNWMEEVLQNRRTIPKGNAAESVFTIGFEDSLAIPAQKNPVDSNYTYILVFKKEGPLSPESEDASTLSITDEIALEHVAGLYTVDRREKTGLSSLWSPGYEITVTQLLPVEGEKTTDRPIVPPASAGAAAVSSTLSQPVSNTSSGGSNGGDSGKPPETGSSVEATAALSGNTERMTRVREIQKKLAELLEKHKAGELTEEEIETLGLLDATLNPEIGKPFIAPGRVGAVKKSLDELGKEYTVTFFEPVAKTIRGASPSDQTLNAQFGKESITRLLSDLNNLQREELNADKHPLQHSIDVLDPEDRYVLVGDAKSIFGVNGDSRKPLVLLSEAYLVDGVPMEEQPVPQLLQKAYPGMQFVFPDGLTKALAERKSEKPQSQSTSSSSWHNNSGRQRGSVTA